MCCVMTGEVFDYLVAHGRMREKEARVKFRQVLQGLSDNLEHEIPGVGKNMWVKIFWPTDADDGGKCSVVHWFHAWQFVQRFHKFICFPHNFIFLLFKTRVANDFKCDQVVNCSAWLTLLWPNVIKLWTVERCLRCCDRTWSSCELFSVAYTVVTERDQVVNCLAWLTLLWQDVIKLWTV